MRSVRASQTARCPASQASAWPSVLGLSSQVRTRPALFERITPLFSSTERCFMNDGSAIANGAFYTVLRGPDGGTSDNPGAFLDVVPEKRIVFTSMLLGGWRPATPWMPFTAIVTMADEGEGTRYVATVMHADRASRDRHEEMGFFDGWNTCITQLEEFARELR